MAHRISVTFVQKVSEEIWDFLLQSEKVLFDRQFESSNRNRHKRDKRNQAVPVIHFTVTILIVQLLDGPVKALMIGKFLNSNETREFSGRGQE